MTEDRELLQLVAKAAGLVCANGIYYGGANWNPLTDDGDALRLAVSLGLDLYVMGDIDATVCNDISVKHIEMDKYAATRRAIVLAAAAIGKAMP